MTIEGWATIATIAITVLLGGILAAALLRAASKAPAAMITVSLSLLSLLAIAGSLVADEGEASAYLALAGVGLGALATALTGLFDGKPPSEPAEPVPPVLETPDAPEEPHVGGQDI